MARRHLPTLERLQALREVARSGAFSAAAAALGLTQPAMSNRIRHLEQEVGASLLERIGKSARPTAEGNLLIAATSRAIAELETALDEITRLRSEISGRLVIATGATATKYLLPSAAADLRARYPAIDLTILTGNTTDLIPGLLDGSIDLGLLTAPIHQPQLDSRLFHRDRLVCVTPPAQAPTPRLVGPSDFEGRQLVLYDRGGSIRRAVDAWLDAANRARIRVTDIGSADAQLAFVESGFGWSIISEIVTRERAAAGRIDVRGLTPPLFRDLVLVWRSDRVTRPIIAAALAVLANHAFEGDDAA
jgi:DNA-binding transcriptional LysR family regulator